jgi:hypothetical protein
LLFSYRAFNVAEKSDKSLNKHTKENLSNFEVPQIRTGYKKRTNLSLAKKVEAKVADFDIRGAIKLLSSDDSLASFNEDVAEELKKIHPSPSRELFFPDPSKSGDISLIVNEQNVREAINSIPAGSSPGLLLLLLLLLLFGMLVNRLYTQTKTNSKQRYTMQQLKKRLCTRYGKRSIKPLKCR